MSKKLDEMFVLYMLEIDKRYQQENMSKHYSLRVEQWSKVLCEVNPSLVWKRNRNLYTMMLLNQIVTYGRLNGVLNLVPPEDGGKL